jgi:hypothetical protein
MGLPPDSNVTMALVGWPASGSSAQVNNLQHVLCVVFGPSEGN